MGNGPAAKIRAVAQASALMPLVFPISGIAATVVGQTSRSARVLQDPLFAQRNQPYLRTKRPTWTSAAGLEACPTNNAASQNGKTRDISSASACDLSFYISLLEDSRCDRGGAGGSVCQSSFDGRIPKAIAAFPPR